MSGPLSKQELIAQLQSHGLRLEGAGRSGRQGGAGPSDHKAVTLDGTTVMVPIFTGTAAHSPYTVVFEAGQAMIFGHGEALAPVSFPRQPQFYGLSTPEGVPYWKIALLHSTDILATTVLQTCMRYSDRATTCQFCAIGQSLEAERTIARKSPEDLGAVAEAAVRLDGVKHAVLTTGTPHSSDRGAAYLSACAQGIKDRVNLPIQAQCEPPDDFAWFERLRQAGVDSLGMHLEALDPAVRVRIMPGKAQVPVDYYFAAFEAAVRVFGRGEVSTYILAGLGDSIEQVLAACQRLIKLGVYPFVVPFVPISGTPLADHLAPSSDWMLTLYRALGPLLTQSGLSARASKAGCAKCGACSGLSAFEG
ncbi:MSMEG_0568 family radical SAM protein [Anthocerotibacter panamensis]|uniref:MSMEG_0568 family radical SAM protein n=1 Tax=Anthocerotibacter panamensis TaxID=2857077 RepID=UPI001C4081D9|nr:MSMEG_0568 family radical SAM protein [Anthocerotibacter panamensis]